ncbi:MAG: hypothetical protein LBT33_09460 [Spirochaetia bacterium]|jgi:hypothetical protein|nr:hypothetical protein [Spirochaetia bacterium]
MRKKLRLWLPRGVLLACCCLFFSPGAEAQEAGADGAGYVIEEVFFQLEGRTQEGILKKKLAIEKGRKFATREELEDYLLDREIVLLSQRVLEAGSITYTVREAPGGVFAVDVFVVAEDTWNMLGLPHFKYDSNKGVFLGVRFRDNNFFGSMEPLKLDIDYVIGDGDNSNGFDQEIQFVLPFRLFQHDWRLRGLDKAEYTTEGGGWKVNSEMGLAVDLPDGEQVWTLEYVQGYYYKDNDYYGDHYYLSSKALFGSDFSLPLGMGRLGNLKYRPDVFTRVKYRSDRDLSEDRRGVEPGFAHKLFAARVDWKDNFREGADLSTKNVIAWNLREARWRNSVELALVGHKALSFMGVSGRLSGFYQFFKDKGPEDDDEVGKPMRGILDDRMAGNAAVFLNLDFPVKMWVWFLDPYLEVQAGPFFDFALIKRHGRDFHLGGAYYSSGIEAVAFPKFLSRSIYFRASLGIDLEAFFDDHKLSGVVPEKKADHPPLHGGEPWKRLEAFIGFGHHY